MPFPSVEGGKGDPNDVVGNPSNYVSVTTAADAAAAGGFLKTLYSDDYVKGLVTIGEVPATTNAKDALAAGPRPGVRHLPVQPGRSRRRPSPSRGTRRSAKIADPDADRAAGAVQRAAVPEAVRQRRLRTEVRHTFDVSSGEPRQARPAARSAPAYPATGRPGAAWALPGLLFFILSPSSRWSRWRYSPSPTGTAWARRGSRRAPTGRLLHDPTMIHSPVAERSDPARRHCRPDPAEILLGVWAAGHAAQPGGAVGGLLRPAAAVDGRARRAVAPLLDPNFGVPAQARWLFGDGNLLGMHDRRDRRAGLRRRAGSTPRSTP